ncbi:efflux transporter outer membrane subunit [Beijerinckia sp. L45]|uniref:efflux transporter outer membrane subunit n=1 Tax=Beijerinckia sp. L45 TaxID=1641855 RepID=UPI00131BE65E|nr:efflux transporter outer membrane subunit [Beijerinckia sp. L45]
MKSVSWAGVLISALVLSACDLAPNYAPPKVDLPAKFKEDAGWRVAHPSDDLPRGAWWTAFKDPTLNALEPQIEEANQNLANALANYQQARTNVEQAQAGLYPSLEQDTTVTTNRQSDHRPLRSADQPTHYGANTLDVQASYEVDLWGRVRDTIKANADQAQAEAAVLESVRLSLHAELARDYLNLRGLDREARLLRDTAKAYGDALTLTQNRLAGKIASPIDVARAQSQLATAQALIDDTAARRALLEHAIATLVGKPASSFTLPVSVAAIASPRRPTAVPSTLLERRPDISAAERAVAAANEQIGVAKAAFYPRFFLNLSGGTQDTGFHLLDLKNELFSIGPSVNLPIFDGGKRTAQLELATAFRDGAVAQYRGRVLQAVQEVEDALALDRLLTLEAKHTADAEAAAKKVLDLSLTLYRDGATTYLDVVTAQTTALDAERTGLLLATRRSQTSVALILALGGGWTVPVQLAETPVSTVDLIKQLGH